MLKFVNKQGKLALVEKDNGELEYIDPSLKENIEKEMKRIIKKGEQDDK